MYTGYKNGGFALSYTDYTGYSYGFGQPYFIFTKCRSLKTEIVKAKQGTRARVRASVFKLPTQIQAPSCLGTGVEQTGQDCSAQKQGFHPTLKHMLLYQKSGL